MNCLTYGPYQHKPFASLRHQATDSKTRSKTKNDHRESRRAMEIAVHTWLEPVLNEPEEKIPQFQALREADAMKPASRQSSFCNTNLAVFRGDDPGGVIWQPRLEYWYQANRRRGTLPDPLRDASLLDVYDYCYASVRYFTMPLHKRYKQVEVLKEWQDPRHLKVTWRTPCGELTELRQYDEFKLSWHNITYRVQKPQDFDVLHFVLDDEEWYWDQDKYEEDLDRVDGRGCAQFFFRRSPIQALFIDYMGYEPSIYALHDHPDIIHNYIRAASESDDALYDVLCDSPVQILNLGENIDASLNPPPMWREYLLPYYCKRIRRLHSSGKFVHIHVDGSMRSLLAHLRDCPWDGMEAATPSPQGDVSLLEIKQVVKDRVLLDGIPAVYFLPGQYPVDRLIECCKRVVELFYPRLILGISDELPPDGDIERVRLVGELVEGLA